MPMARGRNVMVLKVLSNPNHSRFPCPHCTHRAGCFPAVSLLQQPLCGGCHLSQLSRFLFHTQTDLYSGALFVQVCLGWDLYLSTVLMLVVTGLYTIAGGLLSICWPPFFFFH